MHERDALDAPTQHVSSVELDPKSPQLDGATNSELPKLATLVSALYETELDAIDAMLDVMQIERYKTYEQDELSRVPLSTRQRVHLLINHFLTLKERVER